MMGTGVRDWFQGTDESARPMRTLDGVCCKDAGGVKLMGGGLGLRMIMRSVFCVMRWIIMPQLSLASGKGSGRISNGAKRA